MADFPQDELDDPSLHITPSSTSLNLSQLTFTWSLGDIPIVLFDDSYAIDERALTQTPINGVSVRNGDSHASSAGASIRTPDLNRTLLLSPRNSRVESQDDLDSLHASGSSTTLASVGTFGPRRFNLKLCCDTRLSTGSYFPEIPSPTSQNLDYERRSPLFTRHHAKGSFDKPLPDTVALVDLTSQAPSETLKFLSPGVSLSGIDEIITFPSLRTCPDSTWKCKAYELPKIPETPSQVTSRTTSWIHSQGYGFPEMISPDHDTPTDEKQTLSLCGTPARRAIFTDDMVLAADETSPRICRHERQGSRHQVETFYPKHFHNSKDDFAWIRDITVQCLVDQEGFRSAQPSFKLSGIVHLRSALQPHTPGPATAQFRPITRQSFHFHHAALESPPILRRVTVNHQESHDYVSRQAHITLKYNGVYVVHGREVSSVDHDGQAQKLSWQFEYLVDDRRIEVSGRIIEGEKVLTPLTFSCSPELLLPAQGKRINIMHVFKKGVAPKLSAEKLQPPGTSHGKAESPGDLSPGKVHEWGLHRRVQSHDTRQQDGHMTVNSRAGIQATGTNSYRSMGTALENIGEDEFGRRRRASSVGNHSPTASYSSRILRNRRHDSSIIKNTVSSTLPHPTRHIIPPSRLAELFDITTEFSQPVPTSVREPSTFTSLTPRPRSRHAWGVEDVSQR